MRARASRRGIIVHAGLPPLEALAAPEFLERLGFLDRRLALLLEPLAHHAQLLPGHPLAKVFEGRMVDIFNYYPLENFAKY